MRDLTLTCRCGTVTGQVRAITPRRGTRLVCHCADCQAFARHAGAPGITDANGGTEIFQTLPGRVVFATGTDCLTPVRLTEKGLLRWKTRCCGTPMGNMLATPKMRFVGLPTVALPDPEDRPAMGPILASLAAAESPAGRHPPPDYGRSRATRRAIWRQLTSGLGLGPKSSPYFTDQGDPIAPPIVLTDEERAAAYTSAPLD